MIYSCSSLSNFLLFNDGFYNSCVANEVCEKLAVVGFTTNMISYLTTQMHMPLTKAANTLTNFGGTSSLTPLIGAFIADAYAGRFWTISVASIIYQIVINTTPLKHACFNMYKKIIRCGNPRFLPVIIWNSAPEISHQKVIKYVYTDKNSIFLFVILAEEELVGQFHGLSL